MRLSAIASLRAGPAILPPRTPYVKTASEAYDSAVISKSTKGPRSQRARGEHVHEAFRQIPPCVRRNDGGRAACGVWPFQAPGARLVDRRKRARRSTEGRPLR